MCSVKSLQYASKSSFSSFLLSLSQMYSGIHCYYICFRQSLFLKQLKNVLYISLYFYHFQSFKFPYVCMVIYPGIFLLPQEFLLVDSGRQQGVLADTLIPCSRIAQSCSISCQRQPLIKKREV